MWIHAPVASLPAVPHDGWEAEQCVLVLTQERLGCRVSRIAAAHVARQAQVLRKGIRDVRLWLGQGFGSGIAAAHVAGQTQVLRQRMRDVRVWPG